MCVGVGIQPMLSLFPPMSRICNFNNSLICICSASEDYRLARASGLNSEIMPCFLKFETKHNRKRHSSR